MGISLRDLVEKDASGVIGGWDNLLAVIPGGILCPILNLEHVKTAIMAYNRLASLGSTLGTCTVIILNKDVDLLNCPLCYGFVVPIDSHAGWAPDNFRIISRPIIREIAI
jgi:NADH:ubiquinone oxidoreductase subunit F (NADH-binding)